MMLTQEELHKVLTYCPETGIFTRNTDHPRWKSKPAGSTTKGRIYIQVNRRLYLAHRLAWLYMTGSWPNNQIDHINGDQSDNRWLNLRDVIQQENLENKKKPQGSTGVIGVQVNNNCNSYMSRISVRGVVHYLGSYPTIDKAREVYLQAKEKLHKGYVPS